MVAPNLGNLGDHLRRDYPLRKPWERPIAPLLPTNLNLCVEIMLRAVTFDLVTVIRGNITESHPLVCPQVADNNKHPL